MNEDLQRKFIELLANVDEDDEDIQDIKLMAFFIGITYKMWKAGEFDDILDKHNKKKAIDQMLKQVEDSLDPQ